MTQIKSISGTLSKKDIRHLTRKSRSGTVGPTTVYYAGVTAPIISAGVAVFSRRLLQDANFISAYWIWFISAFIAATAGIAWYLIFMRWSYRNTHGRGNEISASTEIDITDDALIVRRGHIKTVIAWQGVSELATNGKHTSLHIDNSDSILIPHHWFGKDKTARKAFLETLQDAVAARKTA